MIGRLIRKTARQPSPLTSAPPRRGPEGSASAPAPAQMPTARALDPLSAYRSVMTARVPGRSSAAPTPCTALAVTSSSMFGAAPQPSDARPKTARPASTTRLWPIRSPNAPKTRSSAASVIMYPATTHCCPVRLVSSPVRMDGRATLTTVTSSWTRKIPTQSRPSSMRPTLPPENFGLRRSVAMSAWRHERRCRHRTRGRLLPSGHAHPDRPPGAEQARRAVLDRRVVANGRVGGVL